MSYAIHYTKDSLADIKSLDNSQQIQVTSAIEKVSQNPLPQSEGGYGKPLGNLAGINLVGCLKIKLRGAGLRVVYKLKRIDNAMYIIVVSVREDNIVYKTAEKRLKNLDT